MPLAKRQLVVAAAAAAAAVAALLLLLLLQTATPTLASAEADGADADMAAPPVLSDDDADAGGAPQGPTELRPFAVVRVDVPATAVVGATFAAQVHVANVRSPSLPHVNPTN